MYFNVSAEKKIAREFGEPAEDVIRDLATFIDHTGQGYGPKFIANIVGVCPETLRKIGAKYHITFKRWRFNVSKDRDWVNWWKE